VEDATRDALQLNPDLQVMDLSATSGEGMEQWLDYLKKVCGK